MKSYTDLKQSKKLAEILPPESADMHYSKDFDGHWFIDLAKYTSVKIPKYVGNVEEHLIPCWSLAALFDLIPSKIYDSNNNSAYLWIHKDIDERQNKDNHYLAYHDPYDDFEHIETNQYDNFVDACYDMILKLHELKLV